MLGLTIYNHEIRACFTNTYINDKFIFCYVFTILNEYGTFGDKGASIQIASNQHISFLMAFVCHDISVADMPLPMAIIGHHHIQY